MRSWAVLLRIRNIWGPVKRKKFTKKIEKVAIEVSRVPDILRSQGL